MQFLGSLPIFSYSVFAGVPRWGRSAEKYPVPRCKFSIHEDGELFKIFIILYDL